MRANTSLHQGGKKLTMTTTAYNTNGVVAFGQPGKLPPSIHKDLFATVKVNQLGGNLICIFRIQL